MKSRVNEALSQHIRDNIGVYFTVTLFFAIGLAVGAFTVKALDTSQKQDLVVYLNRFFQIIDSQKVNRGLIFYQSIKTNFQTVFFAWFLGVTIIGIPFTLLITSFRGFIVGFTISFLVQGMGWKGFMFVVTAVIPQNIIFVPCLLVISATSLCFSLQAFRAKVGRGIVSSIKQSIFSYTTTIMMLLIVMSVGSLIEAYISPSILHTLSSYMITQ